LDPGKTSLKNSKNPSNTPTQQPMLLHGLLLRE
jgi:hypothetical protein